MNNINNSKKYLVINTKAPTPYQFRVYTEEQLKEKYEGILAFQERNPGMARYFIVECVPIEEYEPGK